MGAELISLFDGLGALIERYGLWAVVIAIAVVQLSYFLRSKGAVDRVRAETESNLEKRTSEIQAHLTEQMNQRIDEKNAQINLLEQRLAAAEKKALRVDRLERQIEALEKELATMREDLKIERERHEKERNDRIHLQGRVDELININGRLTVDGMDMIEKNRQLSDTLTAIRAEVEMLRMQGRAIVQRQANIEVDSAKQSAVHATQTMPAVADEPPKELPP